MPLTADRAARGLVRRTGWTLSLLALAGVPSAHSTDIAPSDFHGSWCLVGQEGYGRSIEEKADIHFASDGRYAWTEGGFRTEGRWHVGADVLEITKLGRLKVLGRPQDRMQLRMAGSTLRMIRGACPKAGFSSQDRLEFHNAAITGDLGTVQRFLDRGIPPDTLDHSRGDTGLMKAAKGCRVEVAQALLQRGANPKAINDDGHQALDYALRSDFHRGCPKMVELLSGKR